MTGDEATIEQLVANVERGAKWLAEHDSDPPGRFYLWWKARLIPSTPMPAQPEEVRAAYGVWFRAYERWLALYDELERRSEPLAKATLGGYLEGARS